jgi:hypothetical protein
MVTVLKTGTAAKLSPRGGGQLTYQVGRNGDDVLLRIHKNDSTGRFSAEWVGVPALRASLAQLPQAQINFKGAVALKSAWKGLSSCNSGFGAAILKAEGVFAAEDDPKKKGMLRLTKPDALDAWEKGVLALPVPKNAERVPLLPPKPKPFFAKRQKPTEGDGAEAVEQVDSVDETGDATPDGDDE